MPKPEDLLHCPTLHARAEPDDEYDPWPEPPDPYQKHPDRYDDVDDEEDEDE